MAKKTTKKTKQSMSLSWVIALVIFSVVIVALAGAISYSMTQKQIMQKEYDDVLSQPSSKLQVACTADVEECPDGSFVSRQPPSCEFAKCPTEEPEK